MILNDIHEDSHEVIHDFHKLGKGRDRKRIAERILLGETKFIPMQIRKF